MAGIQVKGIISVSIFAPLHELIREDQIRAILELRALDKARFLATCRAVSAAIIALHSIVPAAPIGHRGDVGDARFGVKGGVRLDVDRLVGRAVDGDVRDAGNAFVFRQLVHAGNTAIRARACSLIADNDARPNEQVGGLCCRQKDALHAGFSDRHRVLVAVPGAALNRTTVTLAGVFQPDHGKLPFEQSAGCARILCAALAPQAHIVAVAGIVDGRAATAAADEAVAVKSGSILRVCNVAVDSAVFIRTLRPRFIPGAGVAAHFEIAITALIPFFRVGILLQYPAQVLAPAHIVIAIDELDGIDRVRAVRIFLGGNFQRPELRQFGEVVTVGRSLGAGRADKADAVIGCLADGALAGSKQRFFRAMHAVVVQNCAEPAPAQFIARRHALLPADVPPVHEECVDFLNAFGRANEAAIKAVNGRRVSAGNDAGFLHGHEFPQRAVAGKINSFCHDKNSFKRCLN